MKLVYFLRGNKDTTAITIIDHFQVEAIHVLLSKYSSK